MEKMNLYFELKKKTKKKKQKQKEKKILESFFSF